jgi:predicted dehydrogenase
MAAAGTYRRLRLGFVGGGRGALIGPVHRTAARLDDRFEIAGAVLSSDPEKALADAAALGLAGFASLGAMIEAGGLDAVAIATPNDSHVAFCLEALDAGLHVVCDKPLANAVEDGRRIAEKVAATGLVFCLTHNYSGYPMIRQMRAMIGAGRIGRIHLVQASYRQGTLATAVETGDVPARLRWRIDPAKGGPSHVMGDIGSHVHQLIGYVTGLEVEAVMAEVGAVVPGRQTHDTGQALLRFVGGARGQMLAARVAHGAENELAIEVYGDKGGLRWQHDRPDALSFVRNGEPQQTLTRGSPYLEPLAARACRVPAGHPEGFFEGFANLYTDFAELVGARLDGRAPDPLAATIPTAEDGLAGLLFIDACLRSSEHGAWQAVERQGN